MFKQTTSISTIYLRLIASYRNPARRRGNVVLLVMVALVLMATLGTSYLQVARVQRGQAGQSTGDIDTVVAAVLVKIEDTISDDARDDNANLLSTGIVNQTQGDEPFDYPWTNVATGGANNYQVTSLTTASSVAAVGGHLDNKWLASSSPSDLGGTPYWENITDLNGVFLSAAGHSDLTSLAAGSAPTESPINHAGVATPGMSNVSINTNVRHTLPAPADFADPTLSLLVDADGDGVPDSRWAWATIPVIEGKAYTMAVRIIDLSGRINLNTATSPLDNTARYDYETSTTTVASEHAPRWDTPAEIDLGRFVNETRNAENAAVPGTANAADLNLLGTDIIARHTGTSGVPTLRDDRTAFWDGSASSFATNNYVADYTNAYTLDDMYELLNQGGVNEDTTTNEAFETNGTGLRDFFSGNETSADYQRYLGDKASDAVDLQEFFEINARVHSTVLSGTSHLAPSGVVPFSNNRLNLTPLFDATDADYADTKNSVSDRIELFLGGGVPLGFTIPEISDQFTSNIADYVDEDNFVTVTGGAGGRAGLEALPFIAEAYGRGIYDLVSSTATESEWSNVGGAIFAIEIANPFQFPISLDDVYLTVTPPGGSLTLLSTDDLLSIVTPAAMVAFNTANGITTNNAATPDINEQELLYPGKSIVFYVDPLGTAMAGDITASVTATETIVVDMSGAAALQAWPTDQAAGTPNAPEDFELGMMASTAANTPLGANYQSVSISTVPPLLTNTSDVSMPIAPQQSFFEARATTAWGGINMLAIGTPDRPDVFPVSPSSVPNSWDFGQAKAVPTGYTAMNDAQAQVIIPNYDNNRMRHIGELAQITGLGYSGTQPINLLWEADHGGTPNPDDLYLDFSPGAPKVNAAVDSLNVPHAVLMLEQFTIYEDSFTPGTINLNTASQELIERSLPFSNPTLANAVAAVIVDFRDNPGGALRSSVSARTTIGQSEGIAYVSELVPLLADVFTTNGTQGNYVGDTVTSEQVDGTDVRVDFGNEYYLDTAGVPIDDGVADDREEEILVYRWLSQVATTRSDCFAAYIWVREHDASDFSSVTDERRVIGLFVRKENGIASQVGTFQTLP
ncbi:hypothetical protein [Algisphaera agarilytica]|uniref:Uncharacterized protein n=1 Tax=Algisphaera agarilytica TaxID=1385975 RepID=A0A7X0H8Z9_9BACT|nr:hypothetical protein [Algisphaera agarilytica]MBB6431468.1 hypothetical protein [Algisphaera agarilytica]